jgi:peptidoglycan hydrolase-like protein with peptidoglycan-binding domain
MITNETNFQIKNFQRIHKLYQSLYLLKSFDFVIQSTLDTSSFIKDVIKIFSY